MNKKIRFIKYAFIGLLFSCTDEGTEPQGTNTLVSKEIHYNFETGEKVAEKSFTYNTNGNVVREVYDNVEFDLNDQEVVYQYDGAQNLIEKTTLTGDPAGTHSEYSEFITYENGLKKAERTMLDGKLIGYQTIYYYTESVLDSTEIYYYSTLESTYVHSTTILHEVDNLGRMTKSYLKNGEGLTVYRYENDNLKETCQVMSGYLNESYESCVTNNYDVEGRLVSVSDVLPWFTQLREEYSYANNHLDEKKIYTYPAYEPGNSMDILLIKYQYN